jgi:hypothetical protein
MRFCSCLVVLLCLPAVEAAAQTVSLSPSVIELKGSYRQSTTQTFTMTNTTGLALSFDLQAQDVLVTNGKRIYLPAGELPHSIAATAVFASRTVTIPAGESRSASVTVTVPEATQIRAVVVLFKGTTTIGKGRSASTVSLGALMTFRLSDHSTVVVSDLSVAPQTDSQNASFELAFVNDGTEPVSPRGVAVILNQAGTVVGKATFEPLRVLPGERQMSKATYPGELGKGAYRVVSTFEVGGKPVTKSAQLVVP